MVNPNRASKHEQGSVEWLQERKGRFTGSEIHKLLVKNGFGDGAQTYTEQCARQEDKESVQQGFKSPAMARGNQLEAAAADYYAFQTGLELTEVGFLKFGNHAGVSSDRLILSLKKGLEIKCPEEDAHFKIGRIESQEKFATSKFKNYYAQCQFNMLGWGCYQWDFISFFPDDPKFRCFKFTFNADFNFWQKILLSIHNAVKNKHNIKEMWQKNLF